MDKSEFEKFVKDSYKDIFGEKYDEKKANDSVLKFLEAAGDDIDKAKSSAEVVISHLKAKNKGIEEKTFDALSNIKEELFDADIEIKQAFNTLCQYFADKGQSSLRETVKNNLELTDKEFPSVGLPNNIRDLRDIKDNLINQINHSKIPAERKDYELKLKVVNEAIRVLSTI